MKLLTITRILYPSSKKRYIKNITFDKESGEILEEPGKKLVFNSEKAEEDAKYDGYYSIITSELEMPDHRVIEIYRGLSDIEDNFKVAKNDLDIRPVFITRDDRIYAHVLTCFIPWSSYALSKRKPAISSRRNRS